MQLVRRRADDTLLALVDNAGANVKRCCALLLDLFADYPENASLAADLEAYEREGDRLTHDIIHRLRTRPRPRAPFGRDDGYALARALDDVVDHCENAAAQLGLYRVEAPMEQAVAMARVLAAAGAEIAGALACLASKTDLQPHLVEIQRLESRGDRLQRDAMASLFAGGIDPVVVIRWKDIFDSLEAAVDACESVAHTLEGMALR